MRLELEPGHVLALKTNAHRHQWNGTICSQPHRWSCSAQAAFREDYCATGQPRCFHLQLFNAAGPHFITPDVSIVAALEREPALLNDQVLVFYGPRFGAAQGIAPGEFQQVIYGLYRIRAVHLEPRGKRCAVFEPYPDGWTLFPRADIEVDGLRSMKRVAYLRQLRARTLTAALAEAVEAGSRMRETDSWSTTHQRRLEAATAAMPDWMRAAATARLLLPENARSGGDPTAFESPMAQQLKRLHIVTAPAVTAPAVSAPRSDAIAPAGRPEVVSQVAASAIPIERRTAGAAVAATPPTSQSGEPPEGACAADEPGATTLPEPNAAMVLGKKFGTAMLDALNVAFLTKALVILTGAPGTGKSWLASRLLDDFARERTVIVPVASTWRGREDLLGYVNPISGEFEPTEFTEFLCTAEDAWRAGDRRPRLVIFEEFNLSQPEHWLSDLLVRLEYDADRLNDRTVQLGGKSIAGRPGRAPAVVLVPNLRFAATLNNDHTVKPLSPRVLDRAALIEVTSAGRAALVAAGLDLDEDTAEHIEELSDLLAPRGAAFSLRTARSLQRASSGANCSKMPLWQALDLVLAQEVLSRVRLLAGDPRDEALLAKLQAWTQKPGAASLTVCASRIADWAELLGAGRDVFQA